MRNAVMSNANEKRDLGECKDSSSSKKPQEAEFSFGENYTRAVSKNGTTVPKDFVRAHIFPVGAFKNIVNKNKDIMNLEKKQFKALGAEDVFDLRQKANNSIAKESHPLSDKIPYLVIPKELEDAINKKAREVAKIKKFGKHENDLAERDQASYNAIFREIIDKLVTQDLLSKYDDAIGKVTGLLKRLDEVVTAAKNKDWGKDSDDKKDKPADLELSPKDYNRGFMGGNSGMFSVLSVGSDSEKDDDLPSPLLVGATNHVVPLASSKPKQADMSSSPPPLTLPAADILSGFNLGVFRQSRMVINQESDREDQVDSQKIGDKTVDSPSRFANFSLADNGYRCSSSCQR